VHYEIDFNRYADSDIFGGDLPNVYVEQVKISEEGGVVTLTGQLAMYELETTEDPSLWYTNDELREFFDIRVSLEYEMPNGSFVVSKEMDIIANSNLNLYYLTTIDGGIVYKIPYDFEFKLLGSLSDISKVAIGSKIFINTTQVTQTYGFDYPSNMPTEGDTDVKNVIENNRPVITQNVFFNPQGQIWLGRTHEHTQEDGSRVIMAGARHTNQDHPILTRGQISNYVKITNVKETMDQILDFSLQSVIENVFDIAQETNRSSYSSLIQTAPAMFSNQYLTRTAGNRLVNFFSIDFKNVCLRESKYASIYSFLNPDVRDVLISSVDVTDFRIYRLRHDIDDTPPVEVKGGVSIDLGSSLVRTYKVSDTGIINDLHAEYSYKASIRIKDPMYEYLQQFFQQMASFVASLEDYYTKSSLSSNYDYIRDTFKQDYFDQLTSEDYQGPFYWDEARNLIATIFKTFNINVESGLEELFQNLYIQTYIYSYLHPQTATTESIQSAIQIFESVFDSFQSLISVTYFDNYYDGYNSSNPKSSTTAPANSIEIEHEFDKFDASQYASYLEFIEVADEQIQLTDYVNQYTDNAQRYVTDTTTAEPLTAQYAFFGLSSISYLNSVFSTSTWSTNIYEELSAIYSLGGRSLDSGFSELEATEFLANAGITIRDLTTEQNGEENNSANTSFSVTNILGKASLSSVSGSASKVQPSEYFSSINADNSDNTIAKTLSVFLPANIDNLSITFESDPATDSQQSNSLRAALSPTQSGPNTYNQNSLANDLLSKNLNTQYNKFLVFLKYATMGRIEYLPDPSYSDGGIKEPNWQVLTFDVLQTLNTQQILFCRVRRVKSVGFEDTPVDLFDYTILNQYFVLDIDRGFGDFSVQTIPGIGGVPQRQAGTGLLTGVRNVTGGAGEATGAIDMGFGTGATSLLTGVRNVAGGAGEATGAEDLGFGSTRNPTTTVDTDSGTTERASVGSSRTGGSRVSATEEPVLTSAQQFLSPSNPRGTS
jgi:hypothetical protein